MINRLLAAVAALVLLAAPPPAFGQVLDSDNGTYRPQTPLSQFRSRTVSAANATQQVDINARNLHDTLAIHMAASAGTASVTVSVSSDNINFLTLDTIAAAATIVKQYTATTVGAGIALSPLSFRYVRIAISAAGVGNTTTLTVGMK